MPPYSKYCIFRIPFRFSFKAVILLLFFIALPLLLWTGIFHRVVSVWYWNVPGRYLIGIHNICGLGKNLLGVFYSKFFSKEQFNLFIWKYKIVFSLSFGFPSSLWNDTESSFTKLIVPILNRLHIGIFVKLTMNNCFC